MTYQEEMYTHLVNGGDPQVLLDAFMKDLNEAQKKADAQLEKKKNEAAEKETKEKAREAAVAALSNYFSLVFPKELVDTNNIPELIDESLDSLEETIKLMEKVTIRYNGKPFSIFDL